MTEKKKLEDYGGDIKKFKKKPVIIRAVELTENAEVETREGTLMGYAGDFLIEGIEGELYPCGKDIFGKSYEEVFEDLDEEESDDDEDVTDE